MSTVIAVQFAEPENVDKWNSEEGRAWKREVADVMLEVHDICKKRDGGLVVEDEIGTDDGGIAYFCLFEDYEKAFEEVKAFVEGRSCVASVRWENGWCLFDENEYEGLVAFASAGFFDNYMILFDDNGAGMIERGALQSLKEDCETVLGLLETN